MVIKVAKKKVDESLLYFDSIRSSFLLLVLLLFMFLKQKKALNYA